MSALLDAKEREIVRLRRQVAWFQRQIFGQKSERRMPEPEGVQGTLGEAFDVVPDDVAPAKETKIAAHERVSKNKNKHLIDGNGDAALFVDESKVPVEVIAIANDEAAGLDPADFEVIGEKVSFHLAQRPGSYVILKYVRPVIKLRVDQTLSCPPAPGGVLGGCRVAMGKKNWLFSWSELGEKHVGIVRSLLATCRVHDINPYDYFVDALQRVSQHPASLVHQLTPRRERLWQGLGLIV
nr:transposase domain-containing protein [Telluria antibiotica]